MNNSFKEILKELLIDVYANTVKDNEEDFSTMYYIIWKMANLMLIKGRRIETNFRNKK